MSSVLYGTEAETVKTLLVVVDCSARLRKHGEGPVTDGDVLRRFDRGTCSNAVDAGRNRRPELMSARRCNP